MADRDYNICPDQPDGVHQPVEANLDPEIADTHVSVICVSCGTTTGWPIAEFKDRLEWN